MDDSRDQKQFPTTLLPEAVFEQAGITAQWVGINRLGVHTYKKPTQTDDVESQFAPCAAKVYQLRPDSILFDPIIRKLVNESNGTFVSGQKIIANPAARPETLKLSRQYRSIVRACIEDLQIESKKPNKEVYQQYVAIFYNIEFIWHLTEILFVNALPGDIVLPHLLEWVRLHFPSGELGATRILKDKLLPGAEAKHADYWPTVITLILQGSLEPARALLRLHSQADSPAFLEAEQILRSLPVYNVFGGLSASEFMSRFSSWKVTLANKIETDTFASSKNLQLIMKIIGGEAAAEMKQYCGTWYELMVASLLYSEPTVKTFDLNFHANKCIQQFGGEARLKLIDHIVLSLLECNIHDFKLCSVAPEMRERGRVAARVRVLTARGVDSVLPTFPHHSMLTSVYCAPPSQGPRYTAPIVLHLMMGFLSQISGQPLFKELFDKVIKKLRLTCDSGWAAAHLTNLLFHCGRLDVIDNKIISGMPQRMDEELVLEYGTLLMGHRSLWQAGISYLDYCPTQGRTRLQLLLPRLPLYSETRANKVIQIALERNLPDVAASICKVEGMKNIRRKRLGHALNWALQSQDPGFATFLADKVLEFYAREGMFSSLDLLDNLGSCMLVCDRLTFLGKYCEFHQVYREGDLKKAAGLLVSLLASKISPKYFWLTLLTDSLPLLESQDVPVFSYKETCELISCLEELVMEGDDHPRAAPRRHSEDHNRLIRLALTKNLARALVHEASTGV